jgi:hypothetical protein
MINELEKVWKEAVVLSFERRSRHMHGEMEVNHENISVRILCLPA